MTDYLLLGEEALIALCIIIGVLTVWYIHKIIVLTRERGKW
jgi:hypothetical protein